MRINFLTLIYFLLVASLSISAQTLTIVGTLDDHNSVDTNNYHITVKFNNTIIFSGVSSLPHGNNFGSIFSNFNRFTIPFESGLLIGGENKITILLLSSSSSNWICWDSIYVNLEDTTIIIESEKEWGYSESGVNVIYSGTPEDIKFTWSEISSNKYLFGYKSRLFYKPKKEIDYVFTLNGRTLQINNYKISQLLLKGDKKTLFLTGDINCR